MSASPVTAAPRGFAPGGRVEGSFRPQGSKSLAQRALVAAALARGRTRIAWLPEADDVARALALVEAAGARVRRLGPTEVEVEGRAPEGRASAAGGLRALGPLAVGESGTLARLATAAVALCAEPGREVQIAASGTLLERASPPLFRALSRYGIEVAFDGRTDGWPLRVVPRRPPEDVLVDRPVSSQEASALALAQAAFPGPSRVHVWGAIPSLPYLAMTLAFLARFGVDVRREDTSDGLLVHLVGPLVAPAAPLELEPDASSAAVALAAACLSGGALAVLGLGARSLQGDVRIVEHLCAFGCRAEARAGALFATGAPLRAAELDLAGEPDLAPVLAAVAAAAALRAPAGPPSRLRGLATLRGKESDRVAALAAGLARLGFSVEQGDDELVVGSRRAGAAAAAEIDSHGDHRIAFAFALLGLVLPGVLVGNPRCVEKSWPRFWDDLTALGARPHDPGEGVPRPAATRG